MNLHGWRYHVVGGDSTTCDMMLDLGAVRTSLKAADLILYTGGPDINPRWYKENFHPTTQRSDNDRDNLEASIFRTCLAKQKVLQIGICRGAQFLNVLSGGKLWQNVDGHRNCTHPIVYEEPDGTSTKTRGILVLSDHHQMMRVTGAGRIWGYALRSTMKSTADKDHYFEPEKDSDPEIVWYKHTRSLCFQPHPEWGHTGTLELFIQCVKRALLNI